MMKAFLLACPVTMAAPKLFLSAPEEIKAFRKRLGMSQSDFWGRIGVTQSGGCRYERGRNLPRTVRVLLHVAYAPDDRAHRLVGHLRAWQPDPTARKNAAAGPSLSAPAPLPASLS